MHNLVLGCLLDLSENAKTNPHITAWRGKDDVSAAHLFCDIWRDEETDIGVAREHTGVIEGMYGQWHGDAGVMMGAVGSIRGPLGEQPGVEANISMTRL